MAGQLDTTNTFNDGDLVNAASVNNIIDQAFAQAAIIHGQTANPGALDAVNDEVLVWDADLAGGSLVRAKVQALPAGVTSLGLAAAPTSVFSLTSTTSNPITASGTFNLGLKNQGPGTVLAGPVSGSATTPSFRVLASADISLPTVAVAANDIDWSLGNAFDKAVLGSGLQTHTFSNIGDGQTIRVRFKQNATGDGRINWNSGTLTIFWTEGSQPVFTTVPNAYGVYVFSAYKEVGVTHIQGYLESVGNVTNVSATATPASIFNITVANPSSNPAIALSLDNQAKNLILAGPVSGSAAVPAFRGLVPADITGVFDVTGSATPHVIDCTQGNVIFRKTLAGTASLETLHLNGGIAGQRITVYLIQNAAPGNTTVGWTTDDTSGIVAWPSGTAHTMTTGASGVTDIVNFLCMGGGAYYGTFNKDFHP